MKLVVATLWLLSYGPYSHSAQIITGLPTQESCEKLAETVYGNGFTVLSHKCIPYEAVIGYKED